MNEWREIGTGDPLDQERDLTTGEWAQTGPDITGWSWTILHLDKNNDTVEIGGGNASGEVMAKALVREWEKARETDEDFTRRARADYEKMP
jgi:hypothetical protein